MPVNPGLAAELALLTEALDSPGTDVADSLSRLVADVRRAVDSYLGLSIAITTQQSSFDLTVLDENTRPRDIETSVLIPLAGATSGDVASSAPTSVTLILFAGRPGAFTDLAADLSWSTGRPPQDFRMDEHRLASDHADSTELQTMARINQALGVLIGRGSTPEQAERALHARAAKAGIGLSEAAALVLDSVTSFGPEPDVS